ncbi:hypothetical protein LIX60_30550 [Streptomyces sp. S07_1.15]|uniref:hypothetical protein n=1 Tax=Streptomyces sp. S07_1.15 TaxID=2873925 RepID=UPI001D14F897|nr:hypothetical protein [Streptomyces sp. S07_1.15]MCC3655723.1 hypothetical protein [Streptomyces sp. S07_1.15]
MWDACARGGAVGPPRRLLTGGTRSAVEVIAALRLEAGTGPASGDRPALRLTDAPAIRRHRVRVVLNECRFDESPSLQGAGIRKLVGPVSDPCASV